VEFFLDLTARKLSGTLLLPLPSKKSDSSLDSAIFSAPTSRTMPRLPPLSTAFPRKKTTGRGDPHQMNPSKPLKNSGVTCVPTPSLTIDYLSRNFINAIIWQRSFKNKKLTHSSESIPPTEETTSQPCIQNLVRFYEKRAFVEHCLDWHQIKCQNEPS
jgi:hypothetical protein